MVGEVIEMLHHPFPLALALLLPRYLSHARVLAEAQQVSSLVSSLFFVICSFSSVGIFVVIMLVWVMMLLQGSQMMLWVYQMLLRLFT